MIARGRLRRLEVVGAGKPAATIDFGRALTFITGASNTGKSHIFGCINFALGGPTPEREFVEARGYDRVFLELESGETVFTVRRSFGTDDIADWFVGPINRWNDERTEQLSVKVDRNRPEKTLGGRLLTAMGFNATSVLVSNTKGKTQAMSLRTLAHLFLVSEEEIITSESPVAEPGYNQTPSRSGFNLMLTGHSPTEEEIAAIQKATADRDTAEQRLSVLSPMIEVLREEIKTAGSRRENLEKQLAGIDDDLGALSELVTASGDQVRKLIEARNEAIEVASSAQERSLRAAQLLGRFDLLSEHYDSDVQRLEFALESGHFFEQLEASYCPRCGRPLSPDEECHPETADFTAIEEAARAEMKKLAPRIRGLTQAIADVERDLKSARLTENRARAEADRLDAEIKKVASPTAASARKRVQDLATRRKEIEALLLQHRELDRYLTMQREADFTAKRKLASFKPTLEPASLGSLQNCVRETLEAWRFPVVSDVVYDTNSDDIVVDGKPRAANGKGVRAVMHAAFVVGLMRHCFSAETPHPGFSVIDSPLTPYKGAEADDAEDAALAADVHSGTLLSLASVTGVGQTIILENIDVPAHLGNATVYQFTGQIGHGRAGFYPST